jgi:hypothetical protein
VRPLRRLRRARDAGAIRLRDFAVGDRFDFFLFADLPRDRPPLMGDLGWDFFRGCRVSARFETVVARLTASRIGRFPAAAFPARAPTTPPTTAPIGPATLPIAAPVTAPAVCFGIGGT